MKKFTLCALIYLVVGATTSLVASDNVQRPSLAQALLSSDALNRRHVERGSSTEKQQEDTESKVEVAQRQDVRYGLSMGKRVGAVAGGGLLLVSGVYWFIVNTVAMAEKPESNRSQALPIGFLVSTGLNLMYLGCKDRMIYENWRPQAQEDSDAVNEHND